MEFLYITDRIAVVLFPTNGTDAQYRMGLKDVTSMLRKNHSDRYRIFNVSKKRSDLGRLHPVVELGWPQDLAPPLDRLCSICKMLESWLATNVANVAVIHCKGGRSRVAVVLAAYMHYINICNPEDTISERFAMQRFSERYLGIDGQPSNRRYVDYFASLLSGATKINSSTIYLSQIIIKNLSGRSVLFKIYERMQPIHTTSLISTNQQTVIDLDGLPLRGDVLVKCFERTICSERSTLFRCQFNTCTFDLSTSDANTFILRFRKEQLDDIFNDRSLNADVSIELVFLTEQPKNRKRRSITECSRADSYENFDRVEEACVQIMASNNC
ncbi:hypothetical protein AB6A40_003006 [Gnathostoma spinigerum]|uniref:Tensin n=1 Tax=Gnathostoma spinigerum TaxID=75299 RepID=A0ABD6EI98_9BILA